MSDLISVHVSKTKAIVIKPFPYSLGAIISNFSGRKIWREEGVQFEPIDTNIKSLKNSPFDIKFLDVEDILSEREKLASLPTQNDNIKKYNSIYNPAIKLMDVQKQTLRQCWNRKAFAHLHDPGDFGKTAIMITEAGMLFVDNKITGALICAPLGVDEEWINKQVPQVFDKSIKKKCILWNKKPIKKTSSLKCKNGMTFFAMNTDSFRTPKGKKVAEQFIAEHKGKVIFFLDESHSIMNYSAARSKAIIEIGKLCSHRRIATGTLTSKSLMDAWSQFKFLNEDILGHKYQTTFKSNFCIIGGFQGKQILGSKNEKEFYELIAPHCFRISESEAKKKTTNEWINHKYKMDKKTEKIYNDIRDMHLAELSDGSITTVKNGLVAILRLQQVLCGTIPNDDGNEISFSTQRARKAVKIIHDIKRPMIIWVRFVPDMKLLKETLEKKGYKVGIYRGTKKHKLEIKINFLNGNLDHMICNPASAGSGQNFQGRCKDNFYYSYSHNSIHWWQSVKRIDRKGASGHITNHRLICQSSVDVGIIANIRKKSQMKRLCLDDIRLMIAGQLKKQSYEIKQEKFESVGVGMENFY